MSTSQGIVPNWVSKEIPGRWTSSCTITGAAHLSPLVDCAFLDGNLLISNDPYMGVTLDMGELILPDAPGLGVRLE